MYKFRVWLFSSFYGKRFVVVDADTSEEADEKALKIPSEGIWEVDPRFCTVTI